MAEETDIQPTTGSPTRLPASAGSPLELLKTLANVSLHRSAQGLIHLEVRLSQVGLVEMELTQDSFVRLMFGEAAIQAEVTRHIQRRRPVHSENETSCDDRRTNYD